MIKLPKNPDRVQKKYFREVMSTPGTKFKITIQGREKTFTVGKGYIEDERFNMMNVGYTGDTKIDLYTYDMMSNKTTATIKFASVTVLSTSLPLAPEMIVSEPKLAENTI